MAPIRIHTLLALSMGGLVFVAAATVLVIALLASFRTTFELLNERAVLVVDGIEKEVLHELGGASDVVNGLVREAETGSLRGASPEVLHEALAVALASAPSADVLLYWDRDMIRRLAFRLPDGTIRREKPALETNARILATLKVMTEPSQQWGPPVVEEGAGYIDFAARLRADTPGVAYIVAAVSLDRFSRIVAEIGRRHGATTFILSGADDVLAHPTFVGNESLKEKAVVPVAEAGDPVLANLAQGEPVKFMDQARRQYVQSFRVGVGDARYLVMYRRLHGYGPETISVGAYFPSTEISDSFRRLGASAVAGIAVTLLGIGAAIILGGLIARPVHRLAESASAVARLELDTVPPQARSPIAEVDEQARAFAVMLEALKVFQTYVPRRLVARLVELGGERSTASETRELTVMFTDIVRFSEIAERMSAAETAAFLNRHFGLLGDCIDAEGGTIDKYIGDAVMAFWGAPDRMEDHAVRAVAAASRISAVLTADNARRAKKGLKPVRIRVGIHTGPVLVGNIGARGRVNYTIVGDTVNDAQRLEALGRKLDAGADVTVLLSAETAQRAGVPPEDVEDVGAHPLAGGPHEVPIRRLRLVAGVPAPEVEGTAG